MNAVIAPGKHTLEACPVPADAMHEGPATPHTTPLWGPEVRSLISELLLGLARECVVDAAIQVATCQAPASSPTHMTPLDGAESNSCGHAVGSKRPVDDTKEDKARKKPKAVCVSQPALLLVSASYLSDDEEEEEGIEEGDGVAQTDDTPILDNVAISSSSTAGDGSFPLVDGGLPDWACAPEDISAVNCPLLTLVVYEHGRESDQAAAVVERLSLSGRTTIVGAEAGAETEGQPPESGYAAVVFDKSGVPYLADVDTPEGITLNGSVLRGAMRALRIGDTFSLNSCPNTSYVLRAFCARDVPETYYRAAFASNGETPRGSDSAGLVPQAVAPQEPDSPAAPARRALSSSAAHDAAATAQEHVDEHSGQESSHVQGAPEVVPEVQSPLEEVTPPAQQNLRCTAEDTSAIAAGASDEVRTKDAEGRNGQPVTDSAVTREGIATAEAAASMLRQSGEASSVAPSSAGLPTETPPPVAPPAADDVKDPQKQQDSLGVTSQDGESKRHKRRSQSSARSLDRSRQPSSRRSRSLSTPPTSRQHRRGERSGSRPSERSRSRPNGRSHSRHTRDRRSSRSFSRGRGRPLDRKDRSRSRGYRESRSRNGYHGRGCRRSRSPRYERDRRRYSDDDRSFHRRSRDRRRRSPSPRSRGRERGRSDSRDSGKRRCEADRRSRSRSRSRGRRR